MRNRLSLLALSLFLLASLPEVHAGQCDAYFAFDGNLQDGSGNGFHGELIGRGGELAGSPQFASGRHGQALRLTGNSAVRAPVDLFPEICAQITITAWIYREDNSSAEHTLVSNGEGTAVSLAYGAIADRARWAQHSSLDGRCRAAESLDIHRRRVGFRERQHHT